MNIGRVVLTISLLVVAGLGLWFALASWDDANKVAAISSALAAVAAVGVAVWAAWRPQSTGRSVRVSDTGKARGNRAVTGVSGKADAIGGSVQVKGSGDATASDDAITGVELD
ncbi:hypothetical protein ACFVYA_40915 [Amycolatopsis sp. NPDC058278]|uniref:hypothetical protein n=1 Tax=Amycolatopsis sp. NPDC058278 TaxID=3346417 RepID=UPI0036DDF336